MKHFSKCVSIALLIGMAVLGSCRKETAKHTQSHNAALEKSERFGTDGRMLIFYSVAHCEATVNDPTEEDQATFLEDIAALGYTSYSDYLAEDDTRTDAVGEDFLAHVLNKDRIVQIGDYLYQVNILTEEVLVLPAAEIDEYQDLADGVTANAHIKKYSTNEDVIELVESGKESGEKGLCFEVYAPPRQAYRIQEVIVNSGIKHAFACEVKYFVGGIYFNLKSEIKGTTRYLDIDNQWKTKAYEFMLKIESERRYKKRCHNENPWYSFAGTGFTIHHNNWHPFKLHSYQGSRGLRKYTLLSNFWFMDGNGNWHKAWKNPDMYADYHAGITWGY